MNKSISVFAALAVWLAVAGAGGRLHAQITSGGSISGDVIDSSGRPVQGVVVVAGSRSVPNRTATTDARGRYRFVSLEPADYTLTAESPGFARVTRESVGVHEGVNLTVDVTMVVGALTETITVRGEPPMIESKSATTSVNISGQLQRSLPLSGLRSWSDFLLLAPGVATTQARFQTYSLHGAAHSSGVYLVDGADATSVLQGSTLYSQFASDTFRDIQVTTSAVEPSSPLGLGPVVAIATESGTNQPHASSAVQYQPRKWNGNNAPGGQSLTIETRQAEVAGGGPLARDRLWGFASLRVARNHTGVPRSAQQVSYLRALAPGFVPFDNAWNGQFGFAKLTGRIGAGSQFLTSYSRDVLTLGGAQANEAAPFRNFVTGGPGYFASLTSVWGSTLTTSFSVGYNGKQQRNPNLHSNVTGINVYQDVLDFGGQLYGSGLLAAINSSPYPASDLLASMWTIRGDLNYYRSGRGGSHEFRAGVYLQPIRRDRQISTFNNRGFQLEEVVLRDPGNPPGGTIPFHRQIYDAGPLITTDVKSRDYAVYVQDAWRPADRVTLSAGLRVDFVKRLDRMFDIVTQDSTEVGPRFGINYMLTGEPQSAVRLAWSRVHENLSVNETQAGTGNAGVVDLFDTKGDGSFSTRFVAPSSTALSSNLIIDLDHYHQEHVDELAAGFRQQLPGQASIDVSLVRRDYRNRPALVETNAIFNGRTFAGYRDPNQNEIYRLAANTWNWPVATAFQLQLAARPGRGEVLASYTREWNHLAGTWQPGDPAAILEPAAFPNANGIGFVDGCTNTVFCLDNNSLMGAPGGVWRRQLFKLDATYEGPWHLQLASSYHFQSGPWSGPILTEIDAPDPSFGPDTVTLSNGRVVSNPLTTPVRFANSTRREGQFALPGSHVWSARVGRAFPLGRGRLEAALDVLNITNHGADQTFPYGANVLSSPFYGQGSDRQFPRAVQLSVRYAF